MCAAARTGSAMPQTRRDHSTQAILTSGSAPIFIVPNSYDYYYYSTIHNNRGASHLHILNDGEAWCARMHVWTATQYHYI
mmetsp:Transcript_430/g.1204  ORF Transcript_430/g.1204 Transcript_430/m.1204 type:complete len:80 (+) Transcript_430:197-436(+)